jgi:hypothetical protein
LPVHQALAMGTFDRKLSALDIGHAEGHGVAVAEINFR